jgi:hypothetical protein
MAVSEARLTMAPRPLSLSAAAGTGHQPDAAHIDVHHLIPFVQGDVVHALAAGVRHGRVVDQAVQTAQGLHGLLCALFYGSRVAGIKGDAVSLEAHGAQLGNGFAQQFGAQIGHHKLRPCWHSVCAKAKPRPRAAPVTRSGAQRADRWKAWC